MLSPCIPKAPQPTGGEKMEKVNARLLEIIRKTRVGHEAEIKGRVLAKAVVRRGSSAEEDMSEKTIQRIGGEAGADG